MSITQRLRGQVCSHLLQAQLRTASGALGSDAIRCASSSAAQVAPARAGGAGPGPDSSREEDDRLFLEMFRRHNSSLRHMEGQVIGARVFKTDRRYVWLDTGFNGPVKFARRALHLSQLLSSSEGGLRASPEDFRIGDVLKFTVEELETPYGDMQLAPERPQERDKFARVWREVRAAMLADEHVMGRVLNAVGGGYSVGVAGIVCFCPISQMDFLTVTKVGVLQPFRVTAMNEARRNVVLADARAQAQQRRALEARRRPPLQQGYGGGGGGYRYRLS